jgi:SM-20-related protein
MIDKDSLVFQLEKDDLNLASRIRRRYVDTGLIYGWKANHSKSYDQGHWNKRILDNSKRFPCDHDKTGSMSSHTEVNSVWNILKEKIGDRGLYRSYINGYTFGTDGYAHQDDSWISKKFGEEAQAETMIMYLNPTWDIDWGGETVVYDNLSHTDNDIAQAVLPKFGRVFVFKSMKYHASRPLSRVCTELRSVFVIKTMDKSVVSPQMKFITETTSKVKHSGRTFFDHLFGTMLKLEHRDASTSVSDEVLLAGLYHAVYGTTSFSYDNPDINRTLIKRMIGEYAENLVFEFCNMKNRIETLTTNSNNYSNNVLVDLMKIESSNLRDQNFRNVHDKKIQALESNIKNIHDSMKDS